MRKKCLTYPTTISDRLRCSTENLAIFKLENRDHLDVTKGLSGNLDLDDAPDPAETVLHV